MKEEYFRDKNRLFLWLLIIFQLFCSGIEIFFISIDLNNFTLLRVILVWVRFVIFLDVLLSTSYKILSNILLSRITPYTNEIIGKYQRGFRGNRSTIDHIFSIRQMLEWKGEYNNEVRKQFIGFENVYDSINRDSLYNILIEFGVPLKLDRLSRRV